MIKLMRAHSAGLRGTMIVPGDKSISHRALMFGAIAHGVTEIENFLVSEDVLRTMSAFRELGVAIDQYGSDVRVNGRGSTKFVQPTKTLDMGNSGTSTRLLMGLLSRQDFNIHITGDSSLCRRPMQRVVAPLACMGANINLSENSMLPGVICENSQLTGITYEMPVASAQVKSAILLAGIQAEGVTTVIEKLPSRDHTERMLRRFGGEIMVKNGVICVTNQQYLIGQHIIVPSDISSAAFFIVAGLITPHSKLTIKKVGINNTRAGVLRILKRMGAKIIMTEIDDNEEPFADITVETQQLHGISITEKDIPSAIDELPIIALAATQAIGDTIITGAGELRVKETDRIATIISELTKLGATIEALDDGMLIHGGTPLHVNNESAVLTSHGDHRIGMMSAIAALITTGGDVFLTGEDAISVSYPEFLENLSQIMR